MTPELAYFLKINVAIILFYAFYRLFFYKDTFFQWRRVTLLTFFIIAFLYPLLNIQEWVKEQEPMVAIANLYATVVLPEITIPAEPQPDNWFELTLQSLGYIYWAGVFLLGIRFFVQLVSICLLSRHSRKEVILGTKVRILGKPSGPFSFFKWIFLYPGEHTEKETEEILTHELTHARQYHSFDVVFSEIACIFCWINPFVWLLKREVRHNLEYMADDKVLEKGHDSRSYQYHLLGLAHHKVATNIYNNFNVLPLKNRIIMMNRKRTNRIGRTKYIMFLPLAMLLMLFSNIEAVARIATKISDEVFSTDKKVEVKGQVVDESGKPIQGVSIIIARTTNGTLSDKEGNFKISADDGQVLLFSFVGLKSVAIPLKDAKLPLKVVMKEEITEYKGEAQKAAPKTESGIPDDEPIFMVVEEMPSYPGGVDALLKFISDNIREEAKTKGVAGRVIVQFTVEKDGSVTNPKVVRGVNPDLDKEALRIVGKMPKWNPGKQRGKAVAVKYTVPINIGIPYQNQHLMSEMPNVIPVPNTNENEVPTDEIFQVVEKMPQFPGGVETMMAYLGKNIRYPAEAHKAGVQGRVIAQFIVNEDGSTSDYRIVRSVSPELDAEAIRVLSGMPTWIPGTQRGKAVRVKYTVPVTFRLSGSTTTRPALSKMMEGNVVYILNGKKITAKEANDLNQHNVESFVMYTSPEKLKEYGVEGADGVVIITTRILTE